MYIILFNQGSIQILNVLFFCSEVEQKVNFRMFCGASFLQSEHVLADVCRLCSTSYPWRFCCKDYQRGQTFMAWVQIAQTQPFAILRCELIVLKCNFQIFATAQNCMRHVYIKRFPQGSLLGYNKNIRCVLAVLEAVLGLPCPSQPAGCSCSLWRGVLLVGRQH